MSTEKNNKDISEDNDNTQENNPELPRKNADEASEQEQTVDFEQRVQELEEKLVRSIAEVENTRNRFSKQLQDNSRYALSSFVKQLVNVFENFFRVIENAPKDEIAKNEAFNAFFEGVNLTHKDLVNTLESSGIKRIYPLNEQFDHNLHQVVSHVESESDSGIVVEVIQAGYLLNGRLLKEALVVIAK
ncbi:MAG: nucleotide exchange factor GrpE [Rickettsiales bacterium]|jgi:molecular chaperone GrpE|nr:nucleotide exchange factor GrpE [Rickettsiales bacterium]